MEMPSFFMALDPYLIWWYRLPDNAYAGFFLGTFILALMCVIVGDVTLTLAFRLVAKRLENLSAESLKYQDLSIEAAKAGDKASYKAANRMANEAFGMSFFSQMAVSMARLWPLPFALAWMQTRFTDVEFPLPFMGFSLGYIGVFIILYIAAYFLFKQVKKQFLNFYLRQGNILEPHP